MLPMVFWQSTVSFSVWLMTHWRWLSEIGHSSTHTKRVPMATPEAPSASAAARPWPSAMPPAAMTGIFMSAAQRRAMTNVPTPSADGWPPTS